MQEAAAFPNLTDVAISLLFLQYFSDLASAGGNFSQLWNECYIYGALNYTQPSQDASLVHFQWELVNPWDSTSLNVNDTLRNFDSLRGSLRPSALVLLTEGIITCLGTALIRAIDSHRALYHQIPIQVPNLFNTERLRPSEWRSLTWSSLVWQIVCETSALAVHVSQRLCDTWCAFLHFNVLIIYTVQRSPQRHMLQLWAFGFSWMLLIA